MISYASGRSLGFVSQSKDDDEGVHPKHRKEPDAKNVGHCFPLKPTVNNHGGSVNWKLAREGTPGVLFRIFSASPVYRRRLTVESLCPLRVTSGHTEKLRAMSVLLPTTDIRQRVEHVGFVAISRHVPFRDANHQRRSWPMELTDVSQKKLARN